MAVRRPLPTVNRQNFMRLSTSGKRRLRFSKSKTLASALVSTTSWKKNLVVSSVAIPVGSTQPVRPRSFTTFRMHSAKTAYRLMSPRPHRG